MGRELWRIKVYEVHRSEAIFTERFAHAGIFHRIWRECITTENTASTLKGRIGFRILT